MRPVIEEIEAERERQIDVEGWDAAHDDAHDPGTLAQAASCYAQQAADVMSPDIAAEGAENVPSFWPFDPAWWKSTTPRRDLIKAAALIIAEIERMDRQGKNFNPPN